MNATSLYVSTCRYILHADHENPDSWGDLYRLLPYLRQSLSCCVCGNLLSDPMGPTNSTCQHHVCKGCIGGKMLLKPSCSWCKDYSLFDENKQLQILLSCYQKLCEYIADTPIARNLVGANGGTSNTLAILQEGMAINEGNAYAQSQKNSDERAVHVNIIELLTKANKNVAMKSDGSPPALRSSPPPSCSKSNANHSSNTQVPEVTTNGSTHIKSGNVEQQSPNQSSSSVSSTTTSPSPRAGSSGSNHCGDLHDTGMDSEGGMTSSASYSVSLSSSGEMPRIKIKRKHKSSKSDGEKHKKKKKDKKHKRHRHKHASHSGNSDSPTPPKVKKLIISGHRAKLLKEGRKLHIRAGCRCGTGGPKPGMFTCLGARCPCFVSEMGCVKCRCRGCRNPFSKPKTEISEMSTVPDEKKEETTEPMSDVEVEIAE